jgi:hypothetical protein
MSTDFWLGLAALPALALAAWLVVLTVGAVQVRWRRWKPTFIGDEERRARHAASLAVARRLVVIPLPGGRVVAWRSNISTINDRTFQAYAHVRDALDEAGRDSLVTKPDRTIYLSGGDGMER